MFRIANSVRIDSLQSGTSIRINSRSEWFGLQICFGLMRFNPGIRSELELKTWFRLVLISFWLMPWIYPNGILNPINPRSEWFGLQIRFGSIHINPVHQSEIGMICIANLFWINAIQSEDSIRIIIENLIQIGFDFIQIDALNLSKPNSQSVSHVGIIRIGLIHFNPVHQSDSIRDRNDLHCKFG